MIKDNTVSSDKVTIDAPAGFVWQVLLDFERYEEWNEFCPRVKNDSLALGSPVDMMIDLGSGLVNQVEYIHEIRPERCIAWRMSNEPDDPVHAVRFQYLQPVDEHSCIYWTVDEFSGPSVMLVMEHLAKAVERGFNRCAYGLKAHAESRFGEHSKHGRQARLSAAD